MIVLWPRLPDSVAAQAFDSILTDGTPPPRTSHVDQIYTPVGASRVHEEQVRATSDRMTALATEYGFPGRASGRARIAFDRAAAQLLSDCIRVNWAEGAQRDVWSFLALVVLPHLTDWRFGTSNRERWVATDLTRHTWARLWWQAVVFERDPELLTLLSESDLNQLLERRTMGGDPRLVCTLAREIVELSPDGMRRRPLIRDVTARLLRKLAFLDAQSLDDDGLARLCRAEAAESWHRIAPAPDAPAAS